MAFRFCLKLFTASKPPFYHYITLVQLKWKIDFSYNLIALECEIDGKTYNEGEIVQRADQKDNEDTPCVYE